MLIVTVSFKSVAVKLASVYVEFESPSTSSLSVAVNRSPFLLGNSGWIGWWSPELLVAHALDLQMFWEMSLHRAEAEAEISPV